MSDISFQQRYAKLPTGQLVRITLEPHAYQPEAVQAAHRELAMRGVPQTEMEAVQINVEEEAAAIRVRRARRESRVNELRDNLEKWWETVNPVRHGPLVTGHRFRLVVLLLGVQLAYEVASLLPWLLSPYGAFSNPWGTWEIMLVGLPLLRLLCIVLFYQRTTVGWIGVVVWAGLGACMMAQMLGYASTFYWEMYDYPGTSDGIYGLLELFGPEHPLRYLGSLALYAAVLWLTGHDGVRRAMGVGATQRAIIYTLVACFALVQWLDLL